MGPFVVLSQSAMARAQNLDFLDEDDERTHALDCFFIFASDRRSGGICSIFESRATFARWAVTVLTTT